MTHTQAAPRRPLTRELVLRAAIGLADAQGIDGLSMRKLAQALGVEAMSLYYHVARKDDLLAGMVDMVLADVVLPAPGSAWKASLRTSAVSMHQVLLRHPWACTLMTMPNRISPARLAWMETVFGCLREAGFSTELADRAYHAIERHITGFTMWQMTLPFTTQSELHEFAADVLQKIPIEQFPYVVEHIHHHLTPPVPGAISEFEFGLNLILDGVERLRDMP